MVLSRVFFVGWMGFGVVCLLVTFICKFTIRIVQI